MVPCQQTLLVNEGCEENTGQPPTENLTTLSREVKVSKGSKGQKAKNTVDVLDLPAAPTSAESASPSLTLARAKSSTVASLTDLTQRSQCQMATLEDRVETVEAEYQRCVNWQLKAENRRLRQNIKELKTEHRDLIEDVEELRAENRSTRIGYYIQHSIHVNGDIWEQKQQVRRLEEDVERLKAESCEIQAENRNFKAQVQRHSSRILALHRRTILDRAREKLLRGCQIEKGTKSGEELRDEVKKVSPDDHAALGDDGLDMVFTMGKIRKEGNAAAHEASKEELRLSVLDPDLGDSERECLGKIYNFMIIEEPTMPIRRATSSRSR